MVRKHEVQAVPINEFLSTNSPEHVGNDKRFNAGFGRAEGQVPKGRPNCPLAFSRPFGTGFVCGLIPALKQISRRGS